MSGEQRLSIHDVDATAYESVLVMERYVRAGDLEPDLLELIKIRASQINGCAFCLDMHNRDARAQGEDQRRLDILAGWHEAASFFTEQEQVALALTEAVTRLPDAGVSDEIWKNVAKHFDESQLVTLLMAIATINVWNRLAVSTRQQVPDKP
jgi:AhpD family alkylhydroperoxidase